MGELELSFIVGRNAKHNSHLTKQSAVSYKGKPTLINDPAAPFLSIYYGKINTSSHKALSIQSTSHKVHKFYSSSIHSYQK